MPGRSRATERQPAAATGSHAVSKADGLQERGNAYAQSALEGAQSGTVGAANGVTSMGATLDAYAAKGRDLLGGAASALGLGGSEEAKVGTVELHAHVDVPNLTYEDLAVNGAVGHTWIEYHPHDASGPDSWGFWPAGGYGANLLDSYVAGEVRQPDPHFGDSGATRKAEITEPQYDAMVKYIDGKRGAQYSVFFYNCTDFGVEAFGAAGQQAPSSGALGVDYPNALYEGIRKRNALDGLDAAGDPVEGG